MSKGKYHISVLFRENIGWMKSEKDFLETFSFPKIILFRLIASREDLDIIQ